MRERSPGVGFANWVVNRTSGFLDAKLSRRSFIARATLLGSAVAATGCAVVTQPGSPYQRITDCPPNTLCHDGYTEFCCAINAGINACPPDTVAAGWWRADYSVFCDGTRYYIDCNEACCGPVRRDGHCAGCRECSCAHGCDTRKVNCNYFRYGGCAQFIPHVGPIVCRMVTCVPPYELDIGCGPSGAVDNSTANHFTDCSLYTPAPPPPPPPPPSASTGSAVVRTPGELVVAVLDGNHAVNVKRFAGGQWHGWTNLAGNCSARVAVASRAPGRVDLFARGFDHALFQRGTDDGIHWSDWLQIGPVIGSDPAPIAYGSGLWVFVRGTDGKLLARVNDGSAWLAWTDLAGSIASNPVPVVVGSQLFVFAWGTDNAVWYRRFDSVTWDVWTSLGGVTDADPAAVVLNGRLFVFRKTGTGLHVRTFDGAWGEWTQLVSGNVQSSPEAVVHANQVFVFVRGVDHGLHYVPWNGTTWGPWVDLAGGGYGAPEPVLLGSVLYVFFRGGDGGLWYRTNDGARWSDWTTLAFVIDVLSGAG